MVKNNTLFLIDPDRDAVGHREAKLFPSGIVRGNQFNYAACGIRQATGFLHRI